MQRVVERAREVTDAAAAVVEMAEGEDMVYRAVSGTPSRSSVSAWKPPPSLSGLCVETGQLLRSDDATTDPRTNTEICVRVGAVSMICLPLRHRHGDTVGVLKVYAPTDGAFDTADEETLGLLSGLIAAHLSNAKDFAAAREESRRDALTGLGNRRAYDEALTREAARAARYGSLLSLVLFDVDGFKAVNDLTATPAATRCSPRSAGFSRAPEHRTRRSEWVATSSRSCWPRRGWATPGGWPSAWSRRWRRAFRSRARPRSRWGPPRHGRLIRAPSTPRPTRRSPVEADPGRDRSASLRAPLARPPQRVRIKLSIAAVTSSGRSSTR